MNAAVAPAALAPPFAADERPFRFGTLDIARDWLWIQERVSCHLMDCTTGIIAVDRHGNYAAAAVLDNWAPASACVHLTIPNPLVLRHGFLSEIAKVVFLYAGRGVIIATVPVSNERSLKFCRHVGFVEQCRLKDGFDFGIDLAVMEIRREGCRWLAAENDDG